MNKLPRYHTVRTDAAGRGLPYNRRLMAENAEVDAELMRQASAQLAAREAAQSSSVRQSTLVPERGEKMMVIEGAHRGLTGTVAYVSGTHALLKDDAAWRDRHANGTWHRFSSLGLRA